MAREYLITGGAGFIGCNYADRLLRRGELVTVYDNLSRPGSRKNLEWLFQRHGDHSLKAIIEDVRHFSEVVEAAQGADVIVHLAAQTAVTTSVEEPWDDFTVNAAGTLNVLEAARQFGNRPIVLYASTNKVYGTMEHVQVVELEARYVYRGPTQMGISETQPLDFHSPYGCSKGAADQYVRDYARIYGLPTVVFRQSCVYGPRQMGVEDQGWVAWFVLAAFNGQLITVYGDGKQVRDVLYIHDLLNAYDAAIEHIDMAAGEVYNVGGGPEHTVSVWAEFGPRLEKLMGHSIAVDYADWRPGDQRVYISDISKARCELDWEPQVGFNEGLCRLYEWAAQNLD